jgi:hypothetical protein
MKRVISTAAITMAIASFSLWGQAKSTKAAEQFVEINHAVQFPKIVKPGNDNVVRQSFNLIIPKKSSKISDIILNVPSGLSVGKNITVSDNSDKNIKTNIAMNGNKIVMNFPQPISPGTALNISLNQVSLVGVSNAWDYSVSAKFVGMNTEVPVGVVQFGIY